MEIMIRAARKTDLSKYTELLQQTYESTYTNEKIGLTKECFSTEIFNSPDTQKYLASNLVNTDLQECWLAFVRSELVGSITVVEREEDCELRGFYVKKSYQGQGIGSKLWKLVLDFTKNKDITCDIYTHNTKSLEMYKKWGFKIDKTKKAFYRHWPEWPEGVRAKCIYLRYKVAFL